MVKLFRNITSFQIIILGFTGLILVGALLLMLPISSNAGVVTPFWDSAFTSASAVCVTGLVVYDTASYWSYFGQAIILVLIQIGGLGIITVALSLTMLAGRRITLKERVTMQNALSAPQIGGIVRLSRFIFAATFSIEALGVILLLPVFVPQYGVRGVWMSVFHSISAFCNAGFDLMGSSTGEFSSLTSFSGNGYLTFVIVLLIILGGIGFMAMNDILTKKHRFREYTLQTKVVLVTTLVLILVPALIFFFNEFQDVSVGERVSLSVFQAVTPRTAGFNTADLTLMTGSGKAVIMLLMLIGGSPGSTAGGVKTSTIAVLFANIIAALRKKEYVNCFGRRIDDSVIKNASIILMVYLMLAGVAAVVISAIDGAPIQTTMFETFSAIGTVGLSMGLTPYLSNISHVILILLMLFGRVGGLTIIYAAFSTKDRTGAKYPVENIMVG